MTRRDGEERNESMGSTTRPARGASGDDAAAAGDGPSSMELSSMPLDPIYGWGIVLEPVEVLIERTADFVAQLARETYRRGEPFSDEELEERFLAFFDRLVEEGTLQRKPDAPPEMGRRILGPRRWLKGQRVRMQRLIEHWQEQDRQDVPPPPEEGCGAG